MGVALKQADAFFLDQNFGCVRSVLRHLVPVADVQIADADEIVGEFGGHLVAGHVVDVEPLEIEDVGHRHAGQTVQLSGVLNQVFAQAELVVAFDPGDAGVRQGAPEAPQNAFPDFDYALEVFAGARRQVVA